MITAIPLPVSPKMRPSGVEEVLSVESDSEDGLDLGICEERFGEGGLPDDSIDEAPIDDDDDGWLV